ncbi:hypothetical protein ACFQY0_03270 [Haloferula chungangensis]|uniref:Uncharacterized protein n=1 Tax=Haloferula chungangensis TaxID=1048331 RepID=A0ABW2L4F6_9BACT
MNRILIPITLSLAAKTVDAAEPEVSLVQYQVGASLSDEVPFDVKPMGHKYGAQLAFLVKGESLVAFKEDSVVIDSITSRDSKELSKSSNGKASWKEGSFPKVGEDGNLASFSVEIRGDLMGKIEGATIKGSVVMLTGGETDEGSATVSKGAKAVEIGPFKVSIAKGGMFAGNGTSIKVQGDYASIIEISATDGGKKLDSSGSSWSGDTKTFSFGKADGDSLEVSIRYWKNLTEIKVPVSVTVGGE